MEEISFRELDLRDAEWLIEINDKEIRYFLLNPSIGGKEYNVEDEKEWIIKKLSDQNCKNIIIEYNNEPAGIGEVRFKDNYAEVGLWIRKKFWGKGLCKALVKHLVDIGNNKEYERIILYVDEDNIRARRCYESVGFEYDCFHEKTIKHLGVWRNEFKMVFWNTYNKNEEENTTNHVKIKEQSTKNIKKLEQFSKNNKSRYINYNLNENIMRSFSVSIEDQEIAVFYITENEQQINIEDIILKKKKNSEKHIRMYMRAIINYILKLAINSNKKFIQTIVNSDNNTLLEEYRKLGFRKYGFITHIDFKGNTKIIFRKVLE